MTDMRVRQRYVMILLGFLIMFVVISGPVQAVETVGGTITYSTSRSVYVALDGTENIAAGDTLLVGFGALPFVPVAVKAVSPQKVVFQAVPLFDETQTGSIVLVQLPTRTNSVIEAGQTSQNRYRGTGNTDNKNLSNVFSALSGRISAQYYRYRGSNGRREYDQPSTYISTSYAGIAGQSSRMNIRLRSRINREISLPGGGKTDIERSMRLYDFSFEWGGENSGWYACLGRTRRIRSPGMGGLDGFVFEHTVGSGVRAGLFGGIAPELDNFISDKNSVKRGAYILWDNLNSESPLRMDTAISYIASSTSNEPDMHLLYIDYMVHYGSFRTSNEVVFNIKPEGDDRGSNELQNFRSYFSWSPLKNMRISANYYGYLVQEYRELTISLDPVEDLQYEHVHTIRPGVEFSFTNRITVSGDILFGEDNIAGFGALSGALRIRTSNLLGTRISTGLSGLVTKSNGTNGTHVLINLSKSVAKETVLLLNGSIAQYSRTHTETYWNERLRIGVSQIFGKTWNMSLHITRSWGQYTSSNQAFAEIGMRL